MRSFTNNNLRHGADLRELHRRAERLLASSGASADSHVRIQKQDQWYVFQGRVSCSGTKAALFSLVPREGGAQRIIDRIHIGRTADPFDAVG